jgi:hypothetical protein
VKTYLPTHEYIQVCAKNRPAAINTLPAYHGGLDKELVVADGLE